MDFDNRKVYGDTSITDGLVIIGLEMVHFGHFCPPPPGPLGEGGGVRGGIGGSVGPKIVTFLGAIFVFEILKFWIVWAFWYVEVIKWIFSKCHF